MPITSKTFSLRHQFFNEHSRKSRKKHSLQPCSIDKKCFFLKSSSFIQGRRILANPLFFCNPFAKIFFLLPFGGAEEDRTPDPLRAKQVLSQLSYSPKSSRSRFQLRCMLAQLRSCTIRTLPRFAPLRLAENSIATITLPQHAWWVWMDSNHRPHPYQGCALTT